MDARSNDMHDGASTKVATGLHETADTARELAQTLERGAEALDTASRTAEQVTRKAERIADRASAARDAITSRIQEHPFAAMAAAITVGFVVGRAGD